MTYHYKLVPQPLPGLATDLGLVRDFMAVNGDALANAACRLGGSPASGRVVTLLEAIKTGRSLTRSHYRQLRDLHDLLSLQHVGDPDRIETALFAEFEPWSQEVEEICLLTDALENLFLQVGEPEVPLRGESLSKRIGVA